MWTWRSAVRTKDKKEICLCKKTNNLFWGMGRNYWHHLARSDWRRPGHVELCWSDLQNEKEKFALLYAKVSLIIWTLINITLDQRHFDIYSLFCVVSSCGSFLISPKVNKNIKTDKLPGIFYDVSHHSTDWFVRLSLEEWDFCWLCFFLLPLFWFPQKLPPLR